MAGRRLTAAQSRDRRSKRMAIGLGAVLVIVGVIQGPKLLKQLSPPTTPAATVVAGSPGATSASTPAASTPAVAAGTQLQSFSLLASKDPFHAQVQAAAAAAPSGSTTTAAAPSGSTTTAAAAKPLKATPKTTTTATTAAAPTVSVGFTVPPPNAALIKTNGLRQIVVVGGGFPSSQPVFKLVKLGKKGVSIGVLGGSFTSGIPTLLLRKGHKITLANQADGSHYILQLVRLTTAVLKQPQPGATPATTPAAIPATTTPATTAPATTGTSPAG